ncbi:hypothetical protein ACI65C_003524, partial [Semiaphis heraclei]
KKYNYGSSGARVGGSGGFRRQRRPGPKRFAREHGGWVATLTHIADVCQSGTTAPRVYDLLTQVQLRTGLALVLSPVFTFSRRPAFRSRVHSCNRVPSTRVLFTANRV